LDITDCKVKKRKMGGKLTVDMVRRKGYYSHSYGPRQAVRQVKTGDDNEKSNKKGVWVSDPLKFSFSGIHK